MSKTLNKPKRMGRPPKPKGLKQSRGVQAWFTPDERRALAADAKRAGLTRGGYLRDLWLRCRKER